jgi:peptidoglycan/LPS O-acetylase OafA/YrhL
MRGLEPDVADVIVDASQETQTARNLPGHLPSLTGLRWWAALLVFLHHIRGAEIFRGRPQHLIDVAFAPGNIGVSFFFILSGVVLAWSAREHERAPAFWLRRTARIYPLHLVTALGALGLGATLAPSLWPAGTADAMANLALVSSWHPDWGQALNPVSWSLVCEAFFYAVFPFVFRLLSRADDRAVALTATGACAVTIAIPALWPASRGLWSPIYFPPARLPEFLAGVAAGMLLKRASWRGPGVGAALAITGAGYAAARFVPDQHAFAACTVLGLTLLVAAVAKADASPGASAGAGFRRRLTSHPWLVTLGEWSFAFYLVHILVMRTVEQTVISHPQLPAKQAVALAAVLLSVSLALSAAAHRLVEVPARRLILRTTRVPSFRTWAKRA